MTRWFTAPIVLLAALPALAETVPIELPSGRAVTVHDAIRQEDAPAGLTIRFRFLEPDLAAVIAAEPYDVLEADMRYLCEAYVLKQIAMAQPKPAQVIVSISDRPVAFGQPDPEAAQVFEAYRPGDGTCVWEGF